MVSSRYKAVKNYRIFLEILRWRAHRRTL